MNAAAGGDGHRLIRVNITVTCEGPAMFSVLLGPAGRISISVVLFMFLLEALPTCVIRVATECLPAAERSPLQQTQPPPIPTPNPPLAASLRMLTD